MKRSIFLPWRLLLAVLALPLLAVRCPQAPEPEPEAVPLPAELKAYTRFRPGTYWIYQDSATGRLDSTWVVALKDSIVRKGGSRGNPISMKHDAFWLRTRSTWGTTDVVYNVDRNCGLPIRDDGIEGGSPCWMIMRGRHRPASTADEGSADVFPYRLARDQRQFVLGAHYATWHSQPLTLGGQQYNDVMEIKLEQDPSEGSWPAHYYWAPGQGIVLHRVRYEGQMYTWNLVRSHIVQ